LSPLAHALGDSRPFCGKFRRSAANIVGGRPAKHGEVPWQAFFGWCGATIVDDSHAITAAHCVDHPANRPDHLIAGNLKSNDHSKFVQKRKVLDVIVHPNYGRGSDSGNDIAIIKTEPFTFYEYIRPACLPGNDTVMVPGDLLRVSGFGHTHPRSCGSKLMLTDVPLHKDANCTQHLPDYMKADFVAESMFCAGPWEGGADACQGDSGGPIVKIDRDSHRHSATLVGVVSWGHGCARPKEPGVYTDVKFFMDWIMKNW